MHRKIFALAALVASLGYLIESLSIANADAPEPIGFGGESPWKSFALEAHALTPGASTAVYTVPLDKAFVMTGAKISNLWIDLYDDTEKRIVGKSNAATNGFLAQGNGHIRFDPGTSIRVANSHSVSTISFSYTIYGYHTQP